MRLVDIFDNGCNAASLLHQESAHEGIQVTVQDTLGVGGGQTGTQVFDHLVGVKDIGPDLGPPFDAFLLSFQLGLFLLAFLELDIVQTGFQDA